MKFLDKILGFFGIQPKEQNYDQGEIIGEAPMPEQDAAIPEEKTVVSDIKPEASESSAEETVAEGEIVEDVKAEDTGEDEKVEAITESEDEQVKTEEPAVAVKADLLKKEPATSVEELEERMKDSPAPEITAEEGGPSDSGDSGNGDDGNMEYNSGEDM